VGNVSPSGVVQISPGQQQWWETKACNFDSVLLFKMGKFYEMFEMDSYVGVEILGLVLMKVRDSRHTCGLTSGFARRQPGSEAGLLSLASPCWRHSVLKLSRTLLSAG
jgi:hypothetical protein